MTPAKSGGEKPVVKLAGKKSEEAKSTEKPPAKQGTAEQAADAVNKSPEVKPTEKPPAKQGTAELAADTIIKSPEAKPTARRFEWGQTTR